MNKLKIAVTADLHLADTTPPSRIDDYKAVILGKLRFIIDTVNEQDVDILLLAGDIFHIKAPSRNSHSMMRELISIFNSCKARVISVIGNHDWYKSPSLVEQQPISVLEEARAIKILRDGESTVINIGSFSVEIFGLTFTEGRDKNPEEWYIQRGESDFSILLSHQMLIKDGETFFGNFVNFDKVAEHADVDMIITGHYHPGFEPPVQNAHKKFWVNPGSISRIAANEHNFERIPSFIIGSIAEDKTFSWNKVVIPCKSADEIFDKRRIEKRETDKKSMQSLASSMVAEADFDVTSTQSLLAAINSMTKEQAIIDIARDLLDEAEGLL